MEINSKHVLVVRECGITIIVCSQYKQQESTNPKQQLNNTMECGNPTHAFVLHTYVLGCRLFSRAWWTQGFLEWVFRESEKRPKQIFREKMPGTKQQTRNKNQKPVSELTVSSAKHNNSFFIRSQKTTTTFASEKQTQNGGTDQAKSGMANRPRENWKEHTILVIPIQSHTKGHRFRRIKNGPNGSSCIAFLPNHHCPKGL